MGSLVLCFLDSITVCTIHHGLTKTWSDFPFITNASIYVLYFHVSSFHNMGPLVPTFASKRVKTSWNNSITRRVLLGRLKVKDSKTFRVTLVTRRYNE